jgi:hypothetical protein
LPVLTSTAPNLTDQLWMVFGSSASSWWTTEEPRGFWRRLAELLPPEFRGQRVFLGFSVMLYSWLGQVCQCSGNHKDDFRMQHKVLSQHCDHLLYIIKRSKGWN